METKDFDKLLEKLKNPSEVSKYAKELFTTVEILTNTLEKQSSEIIKLKQMLESYSTEDSPILKIDDAETIARVQLRILVSQSMVGELNAEQSKKVDLYARLLLAISGKDGKSDAKARVEKLDTSDLIKILNGKPQ